MEPTEVRVKLVLDSNAKKVTDELKESLGHTQEDAKHAGSSIGSALGAGAVFVGGLYTELFHQAMHYGKEAFAAPIEAFMESAKQVKQLAGTFAMLDSGKHTFQELKIYAGDVKDELEELGMRTGVMDDVLVNTFDNIIERGGKSVEQAKELTEQMALAGRAVPGGAESMSEAFASIEQGIIRARNPLVGMISATGLMKGNAKAVAAQMMKMTPTDQIEMAEKAVARMAAKMKDVPMTMGEAKNSMRVMFGNLLETMGEPMTKGLSTAVLQARSLFFQDDGQQTKLTHDLVEAAKFAGEFLANAFALAKPFIDGVQEGLGAASSEFKAIWDAVFEEGTINWEFLKDTAKFVGKELGFAAKMFAAGLGAVIVGMKEAAKFIQISMGWILKGVGMLPKMGAVGDAGDKILTGAYSGDKKRLLAEAADVNGSAPADIRDRFREHAASMSMRTGVGMDSQMGELNAAFAERARVQKVVDDAQIQLTNHSAAGYMAAYGEAAKAQNQSAMENIARFLGSNKEMADAIGHLAPDVIDGGVRGFLDTLQHVGNTSMVDAIKKAAAPNLDVGKKPPVNMLFSGPIQIKQDFRNEDPDRVAVLLRRDLASAGINRTQSRMTSPLGFGGG